MHPLRLLLIISLVIALGVAVAFAAALRMATQRLRRATRGEILRALAAIRDAAAMLPDGADGPALAAVDSKINEAIGAPPEAISEAWQLHHWSPYVLHGAPRVYIVPNGLERVVVA